MKLTGDRILIEPIEEKEVEGFAIMSTRNNPPQKGKIIAAGKGKKDDPMVLCEGDIILYAKGAGTEIKIEGNGYIIMRESDAFCAL